MPSPDRRSMLKSLALAGAAALIPGSAVAAQAPNLHFKVIKTAKGQFRWTLNSANNQPVATSGESYKNKASCLHGIELVQTGAAQAVIRDLT